MPSHRRKPAIHRKTAKKFAGSKMYTSRGESIYNLDAYLEAGGVAYNSAGEVIQNPVAYRNTIEASVRQNTADPKYLYHYTTGKAAAKIKKSGTIKKSSTGLAGSGTYLTAKPPRSRTDALLYNNYGAVAARDPSFVEEYIRLDTDHLDAKPVEVDRDVWKANGNVHLSNHNGCVKRRSSTTAMFQTVTSSRDAGHDNDEYNEDDYGY